MEEKGKRQLEALIKMSALINSSLNIKEITFRAIEAANHLLEVEAGSLLLLDQETGDLYFEVALGEKGRQVREIRLKPGQGIAGWVAEHGEPRIVPDVNRNEHFFKEADEKSSFVTRDMICVPVKTKQKVLGVLEAVNKKEGTFDNDDLGVLCALANQVAVALENASLYNELKEAFYGTTQTLVETLEKRDPYTGGHTERVKDYCLAIGSILGLSEEQLGHLKLAAILHDIGKIGIRDNILLKPGFLNSDERNKMYLHARYGAQILGHIKQLEEIIPGVRSHHERYDGQGYPDKLRGDEIPILARIISVADTFDAMTTDRTYRKALPAEQALEELRKQQGKQFDPDVVEAFFTAWKDKLVDRS